MFRRIRTIIAAAALALAPAAGAQAEPPYPIEWTRQLGTSSQDCSRGVAADHFGNVYISGYTWGSLGGPNAGSYDAFVSKYDSSGNLLWSRQLGTSERDLGYGVGLDRLGNVFITGYTHGSLAGPHAGMNDAFVRKYDSSGNVLWTRQLGTSNWDYCRGVAADPLGNALISGYTAGSLGGPSAGYEDAFVSKYSSSGVLLWTRQLGTSDHDYGNGVAADPFGNIFISGRTTGNLGGPNAGHEDAFVSKYDASGSLLWTRQLGTSGNDHSHVAAADPFGNVFISGGTYGSLGGPSDGSCDAFVSKLDSSGTLLWTRQLGTSANDYGDAVTTDPFGNVFISGRTYGSLAGPNAGDADAFVSKYDSSGNLLWTRQFGAPGRDASYGVAADPLGNIYISGETNGSLGGPNVGDYDAFLVKLTVPEPSFALLAAVGLPWLLRRSRRRRRTHPRPAARPTRQAEVAGR